MSERRPLILRADTAPPRLQELPAGDLLPTDTLGNALKVLLQGLVTGNNAGITSTDTVLQALGKLQAQASAKVDKDGAKVLSDNNFTNDERVKLANIQTAATKNLADAVLLERSNQTGGFHGFGTAFLMRNHDVLPLSAPPSAYFGKGSFVGFAMGVEVGIPDMSYGIGRVDAHWADASGGYGVMRSFEGWGSRRFTSYALDANTWSPWLEITNRANLTGTQALSTISDAGNAAARTVMTSQVDVTDSRLMAVGAFGVGKANVVGGMNLNTYSQYPTGVSFYYLNNASNGPYTEFYGYLSVEKIDNTYLIQTVKAVGEGTVFKRVVNNGVAGLWGKVIDTASAVGAVASGSIIERGSNSSGQYVKFADGTQICTGLLSGIPVQTATAVTGLYRSISVQWNFPAAFIDNPSVSHSEATGMGLCWTGLGANSIAPTATTVCAYSPTQGGSVSINVMAIGRWK